MKFVSFGATANCKTATFSPVPLLSVIFTTFVETSVESEPFWFRRPRITVQWEALVDLKEKGTLLNQIILISHQMFLFLVFKWYYLVKQLAELMTNRSAISVPPQTWLPLNCRLAIHGQTPGDTRELFPPTRVFSLALPHTTATVTQKEKVNEWQSLSVEHSHDLFSFILSYTGKIILKQFSVRNTMLVNFTTN